jgi:hypothetical protein
VGCGGPGRKPQCFDYCGDNHWRFFGVLWLHGLDVLMATNQKLHYPRAEEFVFKFGERDVVFTESCHDTWLCQITSSVCLQLVRVKRKQNDPRFYFMAFVRRWPPSFETRVRNYDNFHYDICGGLKRKPQTALNATYARLLDKFKNMGALLGYEVKP